MAHRTMVMVKRTYLHIAVLTMMSAVLWFVLTIYQSLTSPSELAVDANIRAPITPSFDEEVFNAIVRRENLSNLSFEAPESTASAVVINEITTSVEDTPTESTEQPSEEPAIPTENTEVTTQ